MPSETCKIPHKCFDRFSSAPAKGASRFVEGLFVVPAKTPLSDFYVSSDALCL